jgi:hypothetical protein
MSTSFEEEEETVLEPHPLGKAEEVIVLVEPAPPPPLPVTEAIIELAPNVLPDGGRDDAEDDESVVLLLGVVREEEGGAEVEALLFAPMHAIHFAKSLFFFHCVLLKLSFGNSALQLVQMRVGGDVVTMSFSVAAAAGGYLSLSLYYGDDTCKSSGGLGFGMSYLS